MTSEKIHVYIITKKKIAFPKEKHLKIVYIPLKKRQKISLLFKKKKAPVGVWVISDLLDIITKATKAKYKTIFLANGAEKKWNIQKDSLASFIAASPTQIKNFLMLAHYHL